MKRGLMLIAVTGLGLALSGCFNIGTKPSEITPAFVPASQYQNESCRELEVDRASLYQRESLLTTAQNQRRSSNKLQAFWVGFGNGDSVGAGELAQVKGEILAIEKERQLKNCTYATAYAAAPVAQGQWPTAVPSFNVQAMCKQASGDATACINAESSAREWIAQHSTTLEIANDCTTLAQAEQSYTMIKACVQQREASR